MVGGSAGGIDALLELLPALPATLQAAVLVVLHLPRDRRSLLVEIFQPRCALPLREAQDKDAITPGSVSFAPPDYHLLVDAGPQGPHVGLSVDPPLHFSRPSIDVLFESAADHYGPRLMGILLSGANEDGARGLTYIKNNGGRTIVQDPRDAQVALMPEAALALHQPDHILTLSGIGQLLATLEYSAC